MDIPEYVPGHGLLADRIVVVTAAAGAGIGYAVAKKAVEEGATVVISDVHERRLGEAADLLAEMVGIRPLTMVCDVRDEAQVQALLDAALAEHGRIDVMVNNAGLGGDTPLVEMTDEEWDRVLDVTLTGSMRCTRASMRIMGVQGHGVIVNNASVLGWRAQAGQSHYAAAKAGVMALTRCAAIEGVGRVSGSTVWPPASPPTRSWPGRPARNSWPSWLMVRLMAVGPSRGRWPTWSYSWPATTRRT